MDVRGRARGLSRAGLPRGRARIYTRPMAVIDARPEARRPSAPPDGAAAAREHLRRQIADLERLLAGDVVAGFPLRIPVPPGPGASRPDGPRLLEPAELERVRDRLADVLAGRPRAEARAKLKRMHADPVAHRAARVTQLELGEPGCGTYVVRPRLGVVGRLMGWWRVKLSSGCPSAARLAAARPSVRPVRACAAPSGVCG